MSIIINTDSKKPFSVHKDDCVERERDSVPFYKKGYIPPVDFSFSNTKAFSTPKSIHEYLDSQVYGHVEYKKALSMLLWKLYNNHRPSGSLLVAGASGSGKTEMIRACAKIYPNLSIIDASSVTPQSYKGEQKLGAGLSSLALEHNAPLGIYVIDEIDKLILRQDNTSSLLMHELLKLLEGGIYNIGTSERPQFVNTNRVAFILLGSFASMSEETFSTPIGFERELYKKTPSKLNKSQILNQMPPELQGRIEDVLVLDSLTKKNYLDILTHPVYSPVKRIGTSLGIDISLSDKKARKIAQNAYEGGTGVRSMNSAISSIVNDYLYEHPDAKSLSIN